MSQVIFYGDAPNNLILEIMRLEREVGTLNRNVECLNISPMQEGVEYGAGEGDQSISYADRKMTRVSKKLERMDTLRG